MRAGGRIGRASAPLGGLLALAGVVVSGAAMAQPVSTLPTEGVAARPIRHVILANARIVTDPGVVIERGSVEIEDGRIVAVRRGDIERNGATRRDLHGKTVFAAFIDPASRIGVPEDMRSGAIKPLPPGTPPVQTTLDQPGPRHWNRRVRPEWSVAEKLDYKAEDAKEWRALGFAAVYATPEAGVIRGQGALLSLRDTTQDKDVVLAKDRAQHFGFELAGGFSGEYPGSLMGATALVRQALLDARWHAAQDDSRRIEENLALQALAPAARGEQRVVFQLEDELDASRVLKLAREFELRPILLGTGYEYRILPQLRGAGASLVLPLEFPEAPMVEDADTALNTSLAELQHWEQAPANPGRIAAAGIEFALTARGIKGVDEEFWKRVRRAVEAGLDERDALRALTTSPARMLGAEDRLGKVAPGLLANLVVADAGLFRDGEAKIFETWVEGERFELTPIDRAEASGTWALTWSDARGPARLVLSGSGAALHAEAAGTEFQVKLIDDRLIALPPASLFGEREGTVRLNATLRGERIDGYRALADGRRIAFSGRRTGAADAAAKDEKEKPEAGGPIPAFAGYPAGEHARAAAPEPPRALLVRNATLWTSTSAGVLEHADLLVRNGKIAAVGRGLEAPRDAVEIDAAGRHLTPGLVDAHSHTAIARNVNEPSHAVTTEVRVADALDPTDIDIYRQLAGGVTTANLLHGSANPMGGQNAVIKLRWGADAEGLLLRGAAPGVKFALGENVKQSGWGDAFVTRYPQTRMGVEQVMREHFNAAREYAARRKDAKSGTFRRDLRLEALAEILEGKRLVHVHSYRQDEILMFVRLAQEYGLPVATFQHVLEGYKVADAIASIDAGGSTFADWWGYKMEVIDGIPHNGALMTRAGVVTSFNSDSNEMARRLNMEAAKAVRYGGLDEQEALALVTSNPARQLRLHDRIGALAPGMDADFVIWSDHPLSNFARAEQTWIEGRRYFDREQDAQERKAIAAERERLLSLAAARRSEILASASDGDPSSGEDEGNGESKPGPDDPDWLLLRHAERGIYHSGADLSSCGMHDHAH
jgi:imidazolonepropionase-like amidohydrolase